MKQVGGVVADHGDCVMQTVERGLRRRQYGTGIIIEFYRGDPRGMVFDTIPTSQFLSGLIVPISVIMLIYLGRRAGASDPTA